MKNSKYLTTYLGSGECCVCVCVLSTTEIKKKNIIFLHTSSYFSNTDF